MPIKKTIGTKTSRKIRTQVTSEDSAGNQFPFKALIQRIKNTGNHGCHDNGGSEGPEKPSDQQDRQQEVAHEHPEGNVLGWALFHDRRSVGVTLLSRTVQRTGPGRFCSEVPSVTVLGHRAMIAAVAGGKATIRGKHVRKGQGRHLPFELKETEIDRLSEPCTPGSC